MDINLFSLIAKRLGDTDLEDFSCVLNGKRYGFKNIGDNTWEDDGTGKYQYKNEQGQLIEMDKKYQEVQSFNYGISRSVQRCGSYFSDYNYEYEPYEMFEIKDILIPEKIIPAHHEDKWEELNIDLSTVVDEEEENKKRLEQERIEMEEKAKLEQERLAKLYPMNKPEIIKMVNKNLKKRGVTKITLQVMRKEYFDIVVAKKLESQEWIDYHTKLQQDLNK